MTPKELEIIKFGFEKGKTPDEVKSALATYRQQTGYQKPEQSAKQDTGTFDGTQDRLADVGQSTANTISTAIAGEGQFEGASPLNRGVNATAAAFATPLRGAYAVSPEPVRKGLDKAGDVIGKGFKALTHKIGQTDLFQGAAKADSVGISIPLPGKNLQTGLDLDDTLGTVAGAGQIAGEIAGVKGAVGTVNRVVNLTNKGANASMKASYSILDKVKRANPIKTKGDFIPKSVKDARYKISDIDGQTRTILERSDFDEVNNYFQQARNHMADSQKATPMEMAGNKAESAFDSVKSASIKAVEGKKAIIAQHGDTRIAGNNINEVMAAGIAKMGEKYGVKIDANGKVTPIKGRQSTLDAKDTKLIGEYYAKLNGLGVSPTLRQVDDFVDWAQSQLYKQSKTLSKLEVASDPVIRSLQGVTGDLNGRLKLSVGNGYGEVNARVQHLMNLQDELSRALGADSRKGAGLMKSLFSPNNANTRAIFAEVKAETGIDLFKEAGLAKYSMESVGDVKQTSLLKQLEVVTNTAAELDLTKPTSLVKWLREHADLDGQELANEIIRREQASKAASGAVSKALTPEEQKVLNRVGGNQDVSSANNTTDLLKNNSQAGFVAGSKSGGISQIKAVEQAIDAIESRLKKFDNDGMSTNNQQYKNSLKERDTLYQILGKL